MTRYSWRELQQIAKKYGITVDPPPTQERRRSTDDRWKTGLGLAIKSRAQRTSKAAPAAEAGRQLPPRRIHYVDIDGREWVKGEWTPRDDVYWQQQARQPGSSQVLTVHDVQAPTVIDTARFGRDVARGCLVCGFKEIARPPSPVRFGKLRGGMCVKCHSEWERLSVPEKGQLGLFVFRRLDDEGFLPEDFPRAEKVLFGEHRINHYSKNWKRYCWAIRVLRSDHPEKQQPVSQSFGFLAPGPIPFAEGARPEEVQG